LEVDGSASDEREPQKPLQGFFRACEVELLDENGCMFELRRASFGGVYLATWNGREVVVNAHNLQKRVVSCCAFASRCTRNKTISDLLSIECDTAYHMVLRLCLEHHKPLRC
jgi:hypothetical protein